MTSHPAEPGEWVQTLEFVDDGVDTMVLQGDRQVT